MFLYIIIANKLGICEVRTTEKKNFHFSLTAVLAASGSKGITLSLVGTPKVIQY